MDALARKLEESIKLIESMETINIRGVKSILIQHILNPLGIYAFETEIFDYLMEIDEAISEKRESSFDNKAGTLIYLKKIKDRYTGSFRL